MYHVLILIFKDVLAKGTHFVFGVLGIGIGEKTLKLKRKRKEIRIEMKDKSLEYKILVQRATSILYYSYGFITPLFGKTYATDNLTIDEPRQESELPKVPSCMVLSWSVICDLPDFDYKLKIC